MFAQESVMDIQKIKELALANGFSLKEQASGNMDLHSYVYEFANAIEQAAKALAVPDTYTPIVLALEDVQSKIAKTSFLTMDEENENEVMAVNANELAAYIDELIEAQVPTND